MDKFPSGGGVQMSRSRLDFAAYIPANAGYFALELGGGDCSVDQAPAQSAILAWALERDTLEPYPVTLFGVQHGSVYILSPDGTVERPNIDSFPSIAALLSYLNGDCSDHAGSDA